MKIELRKLSDVQPYPGNPRQNGAAVDAVAASIKQFGFRQPIVVNAEGVIICGHICYKAALKPGLEQAAKPSADWPPQFDLPNMDQLPAAPQGPTRRARLAPGAQWFLSFDPATRGVPGH